MKDLYKNPKFAAAIAGIIIIGAVIYVYAERKHDPAYVFASVQQGSITQTVQVNGSVNAAKNIPLAFQSNGTIAEIDASIGQTVAQGQLIAKLNTDAANASLAAAQASLQAAQAAYQKLIDGASSPQIDQAKAAVETAQVALNNAKQNVGIIDSQQQTLVSNAYSSMLNAGLAATPSASNTSTSTATVTGTYTATTEGSYTVTVYATGSGLNYQCQGLETCSGIVNLGVPLPLGKDGLFITFSSSGTVHANDSWTISVPNTQSSTYLTAYNAYQSSLQTQSQAVAGAQQAVNSAQAAYDQANAQLETVITPARSEDVSAAEAQVNEAKAQLEAAQNVYDNNVITAPFAGQIGSMNMKAGDDVTVGQAIGSLITNNQYEVDVNLSQAELAEVKTGDSAEATFDAYPGQQFAMTLTSIDPNSTNQNGVPVYQAILDFNQNDSRIQPGLTANLTISDVTHQNTLIVPASSIITKDDSKYVLVKGPNGSIVQTQVNIGIQNSDQVEVTSGLSAGQTVATF